MKDEDDIEHHDPAAEELAASILDGGPIDWNSVNSGQAAEHIHELRALADIASLHRQLPSALTPTQWGSLEILEPIGAGVFGEVFRAWDPQLDREVALKLLYPTNDDGRTSADAPIDEGRLLARVRHANVVTVYGAEQIDGRLGLWMEFVHGRTLADLVAERGAFSAGEAAAVGLDLARALAAVHRAGLLHRDVKTQNVMQEPDGRIVLMDFGAGLEQRHGVAGRDVAGTPMYLAPEVWEGAPATPQSDLYSLGVVLYHLVTGSFPVSGQTPDDVRAAHREGGRRRLQADRPDLPAAFTAIVERAMSSNPADRYQDADALAAALETFLRPAIPAARSSRRVHVLAWLVAGIAVLGAFTVWKALPPPAVEVLSHHTADEQLAIGHVAPFAIAPDGSRWVYDSGPRGGIGQLYVHSVSTFKSEPIAGTEGAHLPFFSPDGRRIGYWLVPPNGTRALKLRSLDGGEPVTLIEPRVTGRFGGASWATDGTIVYSTGDALWRISESGREPKRLLAVDTSSEGAIVSPQVLPDGSVLFTLRKFPAETISLIRRDGGSIYKLVEGAQPHYVAPGYLVYNASKSLVVAAFDVKRLEVGQPVPFDIHPAFGHLDVSRTGTLLYSSVTGPQTPKELSRLVAIDPASGDEHSTLIPAGSYGPTFSLSPDGRRVVVSVVEEGTDTPMLGDLEDGSLVSPPGTGGVLAWTPDSLRLTRITNGSLVNVPIDGGRPIVVAESSVGRFNDCREGAWSPDQRALVMLCGSMIDGGDLWVLTLPGGPGAGGARFEPWMKTPTRESNPAFSPDGRFVAYHLSPAKGAAEPGIIVRPFPGPGAPRRIDLGANPQWTASGLYYRKDNIPMVVNVETQPALRIGVPRVAVAGLAGREIASRIEVAPDGRLFVLKGTPAGGNPDQLNIVKNWVLEMQRVMRNAR